MFLAAVTLVVELAWRPWEKTAFVEKFRFFIFFSKTIEFQTKLFFMKMIASSRASNWSHQPCWVKKNFLTVPTLRKGISADYLEDNDDDDNSYSLNRIKDQYRRGYGNTPRRDEDSDDEPERKR